MIFADADEYFVGQSQVWQVGTNHKYRCHSVTSEGRKTLHLIKKDLLCNDCEFFKSHFWRTKNRLKIRSAEIYIGHDTNKHIYHQNLVTRFTCTGCLHLKFIGFCFHLPKFPSHFPEQSQEVKGAPNSTTYIYLGLLPLFSCDFHIMTNWSFCNFVQNAAVQIGFWQSLYHK